jgi:hypothetical protein
MFTQKLKVLSCVKTCEGYPSSWQVKAVDEENFEYELYIRYRNRRFYIAIEKTQNLELEENIKMDILPKYLYYSYLPEMESASEMNDETMYKCASNILTF